MGRQQIVHFGCRDVREFVFVDIAAKDALSVFEGHAGGEHLVQEWKAMVMTFQFEPVFRKGLVEGFD
jgi:hypothetical protein